MDSGGCILNSSSVKGTFCATKQNALINPQGYLEALAANRVMTDAYQ